MLRTIFGEIKEYKRDTILTPIFTMLEVTMETLIPYVTAWIIDRGIAPGNMHNIYKYGGLMLGLAVLSLIFGIIGGIVSANAGTGFGMNLRQAMYEKVQTFSFANIDKFSTAGLITRMTTDVRNIRMAFVMVTRVAVRAPFTFLISLIMCMRISMRISLMFLAVMAVIGGGLIFLAWKTVKLFRQVFRRYDDINAEIRENVSAVRVVKSFVREDYEDEQFMRASKRLYDLYKKAEVRMTFIMPGMMLAVFTALILISWMGAHFIVEGTMTTGSLTSLFTYIMTVMISLVMLAMIFVMLTMSNASAERIAEVLEEVPDIQSPENPVMTVADGSVEFRHAYFTYKRENVKRETRAKENQMYEDAYGSAGKETLTDINLDIHSGETIGLIGGTGSGKSTLISLISRLYDIDDGHEDSYVKVGGVNVKEYDLDTLRNSVSVVLQNNTLFSGTILENLRWGNEHATLEECVEACKAAEADAFIREFPDGYETVLAQGGTNVSGGQKQRLCIARALLKKPKVLILDDSTSAVDAATDARIRQSFRNYIPGTTKIIISQRIASVEEADRIIVMDEGRVCGFDTPENLRNSNKIYQEIYEIQAHGGGDFDEPQG
ncbi:MAG: ABC transporter ATP-binding protein [Clostridia bacterium]|nr:ABC transporter ATP-binding protein [Clostridia bacterium]